MGRHNRKKQMFLTKKEFQEGEAIISAVRAKRFYRLGDIRKTVDKKTMYSFGMKIIIVGIALTEDQNKVKVTFKKLHELEFD
jgi:hypothetical protein